jgi:hypothetical protein
MQLFGGGYVIAVHLSSTKVRYMFKMDFFTIFHVNALNDVTISLVDSVPSGKFWDCI